MITKGVWGGAQKYVYTLATSLPQDAFEPVVLCGEGDALPDKLKEKGIPVQNIPTLARDISLIKEIRSFFSLVQIIRKESPDILHLNSPKAGGLGALAGRVAGVPRIIYTAHGWPFNERRGTVSKTAIWLLSWVTVLLSHTTIVIAEKEKNQAVDMPFVSSHKITLIKNGVDKIDFIQKAAARKEISSLVPAGISSKTFWIGSFAELHTNKGLEYAISAVAKITAPIAYIIIGEGEQRANLERLIKKTNTRDSIFLVGFLPHASRYAKAFDAYIMPSIKEGLPYALLEAGSAGLPIIASKTGGIPDVIENGTSGILTTPGSSGEIERAVRYILENPERIKLYGKNIKNKVEKEFSLSQTVQKTIQTYTNALS